MSTTRCAVTPSVLALVLLFAGCGDSDEETEGGPAAGGDSTPGAGGATAAPPLPEEPPPDFAAVATIAEDEAGAALAGLCSVFVACECPSAEGLTVADCEAYFETLTTDAVDEAGVEVSYDGDCVARVVAAFEYLGCVTQSQAQAHFDVLIAAAELDDCKMYYGEQPEGAACTALSDSNGDDCLPELECLSGTCQPLPEQLSEGEQCTSQEDCAPGLVCLIDAVGSETETCQTLPEAGQPCLFDLVCAPGGICGSAGSCEPLPAAGEPCAETADVFDRVCQPEAHCIDETCESLPVGGQPCAAGNCAPGFLCQSGTCAIEPAVRSRSSRRLEARVRLPTSR